MATTESEHIVTSISSNVFFKEFTFDKNQFKSDKVELELADNVLWLDDLLFVIQVKERNPKEVKTSVEENKWYHKVIKKAKKQIGDSLTFLKTYDGIKIKNLRQHEIEISKPNLELINKVIVFMPNSDLISEENRFTKFYESTEVGNVHIFHIEDYQWVCKYLMTPVELDEYLKFRERIYLRHRDAINNLPEQYVLAHFLKTDDEEIIQVEYIEALITLEQDTTQWDMSGIIDSFPKNVLMGEDNKPIEYYAIIKELAKINRFELKYVKDRFYKMIEDVRSDEPTHPYRWVCGRTGCGFVFIPLTLERSPMWKQALINFTEIFRYKWKLQKCLGVCASKLDQYWDINWVYIEGDIVYNEDLENALKRDKEVYGDGKIVEVERYKFKDSSND